MNSLILIICYILGLIWAVAAVQCFALGPIRYMSISGHTVEHFQYMLFSVQWRSFSVHQRFAMTILGHHSEQFPYIKCPFRYMYISIHVHFGTYLSRYIINHHNAKILVTVLCYLYVLKCLFIIIIIIIIETLGRHVIRMLETQFNYIATSSLQKKCSVTPLLKHCVHESFDEGRHLNNYTATMLVGLRDDRVNITHRMPPGLHGKSTRENFRGVCSNSFVDINETLTADCDVKHGLHE